MAIPPLSGLLACLVLASPRPTGAFLGPSTSLTPARRHTTIQDRAKAIQAYGASGQHSKNATSDGACHRGELHHCGQEVR